MTEAIESTMPAACNYKPQQSPFTTEDEVLFEKDNVLNSSTHPVIAEQSTIKKRIRQADIQQNTAAQMKEKLSADVLACMEDTLLKTITNTTIILINSHIDSLKRQYQFFEEEMQAIEKKRV